MIDKYKESREAAIRGDVLLYHQRVIELKEKHDDKRAWDIAVANLEARMRYNNEHQA